MTKLSADELAYLEFKYFARDLNVPFSTAEYKKRKEKEFLDNKKIFLALVENKIKNGDNAKVDEMLADTKEKIVELMENNPQFEIRPIRVKDMYEFNFCDKILFLKKNEYIDIYDVDSMVRIMSMNEIELLVYLLNEHKDKKKYQQMFFMVLKLTCGIDVKMIDVLKENNSTSIVVNEDIVFNNDDLILFRDIVGYYNISDYKPCFYQNNDIKKEIENYQQLKFKGYKPLTLEKQVNVLSVLSHIKESDIYEMTLRRFYLTDESANDVLEWAVNRIVEGGGHFKFKTPIEHYKYKRVDSSGNFGFVPLQEMQSKIQGGQ